MRKHLTLLAVLVLSSVLAFAQIKLITGRVTDQQGQPVPFSTVRVKGTKKGVSADADGNYSIRANSGETLIVSGAGIELKEMTIGGANTVDFSVTRKNASLTEVVVVGYGVQKKSDVTGNIATVKGTAIADNPVQSFDAALGGKAAGVQITSANGVVNNPPVFRIRGTNTISLSSYPLIVIDGVPTFTGDVSGSEAAANPLASINPADIESLDVLKDAAATAIYGSRAANGVVIVTTKRGKRGKAKVTYDGWVGQTKATRLWKMLNADQYMTLKNEGVTNNPPANPATAAKFLPTNGPDGKPINTNWNDFVYRNGISHSHALNVSGGNEVTTYYLSAGYTNQQGIIVKNSFARKTFRFSLDHKVSKVISVGATAGYSNEINLAATSSGSLPGEAYNTGGLGRIGLILPPNISPYNNDGTYNTNGSAIGAMNNLNAGISYYNPVVLINNSHTSTENNHIQSNVYMQVKPIPDVTLRTVYGIDNLNSDNDFFNTPLNGDSYPGGRAFNSLNKYKRWIWTSTGQYDHIFADKHSVSFLAGTEQQATKTQGFGINRTNISDPYFTNAQGGWLTDASQTTNKNLGQNYLVSGFGRLNYDYEKKYFLGGSYRRDGYSAFAPGKKYGNFWSASAAWDLAKESFWAGGSIGKVVNTFRLRGSYGTVGNISGITDFASYFLYDARLYNGSSALYYYQTGNSNLSWETSKKTDIGVQFGLFNDLVTGDVAWYRNNIDGLIIYVPQSGSTGIPFPDHNLTIPTNVGSMYNKGVEISLSARPIATKEFRWNTSFNITFNSNKVTALAPGVPNITYTTSSLEQTRLTQVGYSIGTIYVLPTAGVDPATGRRIFVNAAGQQLGYDYKDKKYYDLKTGAAGTAIDPVKDKRPMYNAVPKFYGGFSNDFHYANFDLGVLISYEGGFYVYNGTQASIRDNRFWNSSTDMLRRWTTVGQKTDIPKIWYGDNISNGSANPISENVQKGDFVKLRNVSLGYTLPAKLVQKAGISNARAYVSGQNLLIITKYKGADPEVSTNGNDAQGQGIDRNSVANGRVLTIGLNIGF
jgi:TonB-linked SusC/RagA family outer membrane protein